MASGGNGGEKRTGSGNTSVVWMIAIALIVSVGVRIGFKRYQAEKQRAQQVKEVEDRARFARQHAERAERQRAEEARQRAAEDEREALDPFDEAGGDESPTDEAGENEPEIFRVGGEVTHPIGIYQPQPDFTENARKARIQGIVILQAVIDANGDVKDVKALKGLGLGLTDEAIETVRKWKFEPATRRGKKVAVYYTFTVNFRLDK